MIQPAAEPILTARSDHYVRQSEVFRIERLRHPVAVVNYWSKNFRLMRFHLGP
jgi:hypothetical protein